MTKSEEILIQLLAMGDAIWRPFRQADWTPPCPTNIYEKRKKFVEGGLPFTVGGSQSNRKSGERLLGNLIASGLIEKSGSGKAAGIKLTGYGDQFARALVGLPPVDYAYSMLCRILELEAVADGLPELGPLCPEIWLIENCETINYPIELSVLEDEILPCLVRGWVVSDSDCRGRVYYSATPLGREIAQAPAPVLPSNQPVRDDAAWDLYFDERRSFREKLRSMKPNCPGQIGFLPLPCSLDIHPRKPLEETADATS